jgi:iron complex transport system ATP-binding protein
MPHATGVYETAEDHAAVTSALATTGTSPLRLRDFRTLSGGEKQRVVLASALAQQSRILLLDEPANHLDLQHQLALHRLLRDLSQQGLLVIAVTHDLNLAAAYAGRIVLMNHGLIVADGAPAKVLESGLIKEVFQVKVDVHVKPSGQPWLVYGE